MGPCDLFIIVNAGPAAAQFDLQVVAAVGEDSRESRRFVADRTDGLQSAAGPGALLFAVPEGISSGESAVGSHASACSDSSADEVSRDQAGSASSDPARRRNVVSSSCARSNPAEAKVPKKPVRRVKSDVAPATANSLAQTEPQTSSRNRPSSDKRSCRGLAGDETLP
jgi:hypothetical protein